MRSRRIAYIILNSLEWARAPVSVRDPGRVVRHCANSANHERLPLAIARRAVACIAPAQHGARGRAKLHMSLLPVIDPGAIKQHRIAVNYENTELRHVSACTRRSSVRRKSIEDSREIRSTVIVLPKVFNDSTTVSSEQTAGARRERNWRHTIAASRLCLCDTAQRDAERCGAARSGTERLHWHVCWHVLSKCREDQHRRRWQQQQQQQQCFQRREVDCARERERKSENMSLDFREWTWSKERERERSHGEPDLRILGRDFVDGRRRLHMWSPLSGRPHLADAMKKFTIKGVLDGFRSSVPQPTKPDQEIIENLRPEHFQVKKVSMKSSPWYPSTPFSPHFILFPRSP